MSFGKLKDSYMFNQFPIGLLVFEKKDFGSYKLKYMNEYVEKVFKPEELEEKSKLFFKSSKFYSKDIRSTFGDNVNSLYHLLYKNEMEEDQIIQEKFICDENMVFVNIKSKEQYKMISIENFCEERKALENNLLKNIKSKYLITLSHELKNPMNSLINTIEEIVDENIGKKRELLIGRIKTNLTFIKFFIKNFIMSIKFSIEGEECLTHENLRNKSNKTVSLNLEYLLTRICNKFADLFANKHSVFKQDFSSFNNIVVNYEYIYFKWLIKNVYIFLYNNLEQNSSIEIKTKIKKDKLIMTFKIFTYKDSIKLMKPEKGKTSSHINLNKDILNELLIESSVKSNDIVKEVMITLASLLKIDIKFPSAIDDFIVELSVDYIQENLSEDEHNLGQELSARESKSTNISFISKTQYFTWDLRSEEIMPVKRSKYVKTCEDWRRNIGIRHSSTIQKEDLKFISLDNENKKNKNKIYSNEFLDLSTGLKQILLNIPPYTKYKMAPKKISHDYKNINNNNSLEKNCDSSNKMNFTFKDTHESENLEVKESNHVTHNLGVEFVKRSTKHFDSCRSSKKDLDIKIEKQSKDKSRHDNNFPVRDSKHNKFRNICQMTKENYNKENDSNSDISSNNLSEDEKPPLEDVLIVDDEFFNLNIMKFILKKHKINSDTCVNGVECLEKIIKKDYKLVLMDVMMPEMDGIEASMKIQEMIDRGELKKSINVVIISAHDVDEIIEKTKKIKVVKEFLSKPVKKEKINEILDKYYFT